MQRESLGMYSSRVCVENRCVSTPARKDYVVRGATCPGRCKAFFFLLHSNHQRATSTHVYNRFPLIPMRSMNKSDDLFGGEGNVRAVRPTKHIKFKINKLTTAGSQDQNQKPHQEYSRLPKRVSCGVVLMASTILH